MNAVQIVIFQKNAAVYVNQRFYELIDDITDIEQILETVKKVGHFEYQIYHNESLGFLHEEIDSLPLLFDDAIQYEATASMNVSEAYH